MWLASAISPAGATPMRGGWFGSGSVGVGFGARGYDVRSSVVNHPMPVRAKVVVTRISYLRKLSLNRSSDNIQILAHGVYF
jgi:hypothetical protein